MSEPRELTTVMLNVGRLGKRELEELRAGRGAILEQAVEAAQAAPRSEPSALGADAPPILPVVILIEKRRKKKRTLLGELLRGMR